MSEQPSEYSGARELRAKAAGVASEMMLPAAPACAECAALRERVLIEHGRYRAMEALRLQAVQTSEGHLEAGRRLVKAAAALRDAALPIVAAYPDELPTLRQALADYERVVFGVQRPVVGGDR